MCNPLLVQVHDTIGNNLGGHTDVCKHRSALSTYRIKPLKAQWDPFQIESAVTFLASKSIPIWVLIISRALFIYFSTFHLMNPLFSQMLLLCICVSLCVPAIYTCCSLCLQLSFPPFHRLAQPFSFYIVITVLGGLVLSACSLLWEHPQHETADVCLLTCPPADRDISVAIPGASIFSSQSSVSMLWWLIREIELILNDWRVLRTFFFLSQSAILWYFLLP